MWPFFNFLELVSNWRMNLSSEVFWKPWRKTGIISSKLRAISWLKNQQESLGYQIIYVDYWRVRHSKRRRIVLHHIRQSWAQTSKGKRWGRCDHHQKPLSPSSWYQKNDLHILVVGRKEIWGQRRVKLLLRICELHYLSKKRRVPCDCTNQWIWPWRW